MTPEYQLAHDLLKLSGDHLAQIKRLQAEIAEIRWVHQVSCESNECS